MKKIYKEPEMLTVTFLFSDVITASVGLICADIHDAESMGSSKSVLGFEEF